MSDSHDHGDFLDDGDYAATREEGDPPRWFLLHEERLKWWATTYERVWSEGSVEDRCVCDKKADWSADYRKVKA